ncbi:MAG: tetratricopeptide repeat-containing sensor histidine kinase [Bacteroidota bacterium]
MKAVLVSLFLAFSFCVSAQKENAFFMRLNQANQELKTNPEKAFKLLKKLEKDTISYSKEQKRQLFLTISAYYKNSFDFDHERDYLLQCLSFGTPPKNRCEIYYKLAANASQREEYDEVTDYLTKIFRIEKYAEASVLANAQTLMGVVCLKIGDFDQAEKYLMRAIASCNMLNKPGGLMHAYINMGALKHVTKDFANALYYFRKALEVIPSNDLYNIGFVKTSIGAVYVDLEKYDSAEVYIREALDIISLTADEDSERSCINSLATIRRDQGKYREALNYYLKALPMENRIGSKEDKKTILLNLSEVYEKLGNTNLSLDYYKQYTDLKDKLFNQEKSDFIVETREKYQASKRQKEIAELKITKQQDETEKLNMRYGMLIGVISFLLIALAAFTFFRLKTLRARNAARLALISASLDAEERERLRISQEIHDDLGGILGMSRMLFSNTKKILRPQAEELYDRIDQLLVMANTRSRAISHELFSPTLKEFGLVKALEEQFDHIRLAHPGIELKLDALESLRLDPQLELNLFRISQEVLNNTLKYAKASAIELKIEIRAAFLHFSYIDNGIGFDTSRLKKGVGLNSIDSRVQRFEGQSSIKTSPDKGFQLEIKIPL